MTLDKMNATATDIVTPSVPVTNNSTMNGTEVVQAYVIDQYASVAVPDKMLLGFSKVVIPPGQTLTVEIPLNVSDMGLWNRSIQYVVELGAFVVQIGSSSLGIQGNATFYVS